MTKRRLFTPGPTPLLPEAVFQSLISPMHHRKEDFKAIFREVQKGLQQVYKTQNEILLLSCSGSGAMEAAMTNLLDPGEKAVVAVSHSLLVIIYQILSSKQPYSDLGADSFEQRDSARLTQRSVRQLEALGYAVTLVPKEVA